MTTETKIEEMIEDLLEEFDYVGVRTTEAPMDIENPTNNNSNVWDFETPTDEPLDGVCTTDHTWDWFDIHFVGMMVNGQTYPHYDGAHKYLIAGYSASWGEDDGEQIIQPERIVDISEYFEQVA